MSSTALPPLLRTIVGFWTAFNNGTCASSKQLFISTGEAFTRFPLGKLLFKSLSSGIAIIWISPHLSQFSKDLVERLGTLKNLSIKSMALVLLTGNGSRDLDSLILFSIPWLLLCSSELEAANRKLSISLLLIIF